MHEEKILGNTPKIQLPRFGFIFKSEAMFLKRDSLKKILGAYGLFNFNRKHAITNMREMTRKNIRAIPFIQGVPTKSAPLSLKKIM